MNLIIGALARLMQEVEAEASQRRDIGHMHLMRLLDKARLVRLEAFKLVDTQRSTALADTLRGIDDTTDRSASFNAKVASPPLRLLIVDCCTNSPSSLHAPHPERAILLIRPSWQVCTAGARGKRGARGTRGEAEAVALAAVRAFSRSAHASHLQG